VGLDVTAKEEEDFRIRMVKLFREYKLEWIDERLYDFKLGEHRFQVEISMAFYIVHHKEGDKEEERITCTNPDNVYDRMRNLLNKIS
jgi:hypothetical protein